MTSPLEPTDQRSRQLRRLTEVSRALTYAVSLDEVLQLTTERAAALLETDRAVLMLDATTRVCCRCARRSASTSS